MAAALPDAELSIGQAAPDLTLTALDGTRRLPGRGP